jgi:hypothetical protein
MASGAIVAALLLPRRTREDQVERAAGSVDLDPNTEAEPVLV